jgi:hypothetical protein
VLVLVGVRGSFTRTPDVCARARGAREPPLTHSGAKCPDSSLYFIWVPHTYLNGDERDGTEGPHQ